MSRALCLLLCLAGCSGSFEEPRATALEPGAAGMCTPMEPPPGPCSPSLCPDVVCGRFGQDPGANCSCDGSFACDRNAEDDGMCLCDRDCSPVVVQAFCQATETTCHLVTTVCDPDNGRREPVEHHKSCSDPNAEPPAPVPEACPPTAPGALERMMQACAPAGCPERACSAAAAALVREVGASVVDYQCTADQDRCDAQVAFCDPRTGEQRVESITKSCENCAPAPDPPECQVHDGACEHDCMGAVLGKMTAGHVVTGWGCVTTRSRCLSVVTDCDPATGAEVRFYDKLFCDAPPETE